MIDNYATSFLDGKATLPTVGGPDMIRVIDAMAPEALDHVIHGKFGQIARIHRELRIAIEELNTLVTRRTLT